VDDRKGVDNYVMEEEEGGEGAVICVHPPSRG